MGHKILSPALVPILVLGIMLETACTLHGRIYNLSTGEVTPIAIRQSGLGGRGKLSAVVASSGEKVNGEYVTYAHIPVNWGKIYSKVYGAEGSADTGPPRGALTQYGTAVATGDQGMVIDCEYVTASLTHGSGVCVDKQDTLYKFMF